MCGAGNQALAQSAGLTGRNAINEILYHDVFAQIDGKTVTYQFKPNGHVSLEQDGQVLNGYYGDQHQENRICLDFGKAKHGCYSVALNGTVLQLKDIKGVTFTGSVGTAKKRYVPEAFNPELCKQFRLMRTEGAAEGNFDQLIDLKKKLETNKIQGAVAFEAKIGFAGEYCKVDAQGDYQHIDCILPVAQNDADADGKYEYFVNQFRSCMAKNIVNEKIDVRAGDKYEEAFRSGNKFSRQSIIGVGEKIEAVIGLGWGGCSTTVNCQYRHGVQFRMTANFPTIH